jgi:hypothetical protein
MNYQKNILFNETASPSLAATGSIVIAMSHSEGWTKKQSHK